MKSPKQLIVPGFALLFLILGIYTLVTGALATPLAILLLAAALLNFLVWFFILRNPQKLIDRFTQREQELKEKMRSN